MSKILYFFFNFFFFCRALSAPESLVPLHNALEHSWLVAGSKQPLQGAISLACCVAHLERALSTPVPFFLYKLGDILSSSLQDSSEAVCSPGSGRLRFAVSSTPGPMHGAWCLGTDLSQQLEVPAAGK